MIKKLHSKVKIFFPNPYVVRVQYAESGELDYDREHRRIVRNTYDNILGTWGYSDVIVEQVRLPLESRVSYFDYEVVARAYFCFLDNVDALQFRLSVPDNAVQVRMWPSCLFTIHEVCD